jgi:hypothetical protein
MHSLQAAPGIRLADSTTPEATTQSDRSHKNARLTGNRDDGTYYSLLALRPSVARCLCATYQNETLSTHMGGPSSGISQQPQPFRFEHLFWTTICSPITWQDIRWNVWRLRFRMRCNCRTIEELKLAAGSEDCRLSFQSYRAGRHIGSSNQHQPRTGRASSSGDIPPQSSDRVSPVQMG